MTSPPRGLLDICLVLDIVDEYGEAVAYDLIGLGLRLRHLGTDRLSYGDLHTIIHNQPPTEASALYRAINPDDWPWSMEAQLLAAAVDELRVGNWQRGRGKKRDFPKPITRPGVEPDSTTYGGKKPLPMDDMAEWLGWT